MKKEYDNSLFALCAAVLFIAVSYVWRMMISAAQMVLS